MHDPRDGSEPLTVLPAEPPRGWPWPAWLVIVAAACVPLVVRAVRPPDAAQAFQERVGRVVMQMQARYLVGLRELLGMPGRALYDQAQVLNTGPVDQRVRFIVLAGELAGPDEALNQLQRLDARVEQAGLPPNQAHDRLRTVLRQLYTDYARRRFDAPSVRPAEQEFLRRELGWFGDLALAPASDPDAAERAAALRPARRTATALLAAGLTGLGLGGIGLVALVVFLVLFFTGRLQRSLDGRSPNGGIYAETFALWMLLYLGLSWVVTRIDVGDALLLVQGAVMLLSLATLAWPCLRGVPWGEVRRDIGWTAGRRPLAEPLLGVGSYAMALPLLGVGVLIMFGIAALQGGLPGMSPPDDTLDPTDTPAHPVVVYLTRPDGWRLLQLFVLASVVAPIVEETMFRGVLYRHLRSASARLGSGASVLVSATLVSFIFAFIHPQGLIAIPPLMGLALGFNLVREWRGTLIPSMVAHGLNNGLVLGFAVAAVGE
jgi:membrane protease YdiL (CAAX protease family)